MKPILSETREWKELNDHYQTIKQIHLRELFATDRERAEKFTIHDDGLHVDYSKNLITDRTLDLLFKLAQSRGLKDEIEKMFSGEKINQTEDRPVLHVALRNFSQVPVILKGKDIMPAVFSELQKMKNKARRIRQGTWRGFSGKRIKHIVNIGIGGSDLGPFMMFNALRFYTKKNLDFNFISNVDGTQIRETLSRIHPEKTLFIISSKTFTTDETMTNAGTAKQWILSHFKNKRAMKNHFIAVTANPANAVNFGIDDDQVLKIWDWVGGRFSVTSAIGFSIMVAIGYRHFIELLGGFHCMDNHFRHAPFERNIPVVLAMLGIWYINFFLVPTHAIIPYDHYLGYLPAYLQQLDMESSGKSVNRAGESIPYHTGPVVWGMPGTNGQHAFFQLLHQGTRMITSDFIGFCESLNPVGDHHQKLLAHFLAQTSALAFGKTKEELIREGVPEKLISHKICWGNRPSNTILAERLTPFMLGRLLAMYEHKVFTQGVIWDIFSFDQWGVELGKTLARKIFDALHKSQGKPVHFDGSTDSLIAVFRDGQKSKKNQKL